MAVLKFGKHRYDGVAKIQVADLDDKQGIIKGVCYNGQLIQLTFNKSSNIRIECSGNLQDLQCNNCATIIGDVTYAKVGNSLIVEGTIDNFKSSRNNICEDKTLKVCYGTEKIKREGWKIGKSRIIHIEGDLSGLVVNATNVRIETVIFGKVQEVNTGNMLEVKGTVHDCYVNNMIYCTMGKSIAKSTQKILSERKRNSNNILNNFFMNC